jgi:hypothetical protein
LATLSILTFTATAQTPAPAKPKSDPAPAAKPKAKPEKRVRVEIRTELGTMVGALLRPQHATTPSLVNEHYYDSLLWHRIIPQFMARGGDPSSSAQPRHAAGQRRTGLPSPLIVPGLVHKRARWRRQGWRPGQPPTRQQRPSSTSCRRTYNEGELNMYMQRNQVVDTTYTEQKKPTPAGGTPQLDGAYTVSAGGGGSDVIDKLRHRAAPTTGLSRTSICMRVLREASRAHNEAGDE